MQKKKRNYKFKTRNIVASIIVLLILLAIIFYIYESIKSNGNKIYVANEGDGTISVIGENSFRVVGTINLAGMPHNVNVDPLGRYVYATNDEGHEDADHDMAQHTPYLRIIDAQTNHLVKSIAMEEMAAHVVPTRNGNIAYVSIEGSNKIIEVDINNFKITRKLEVGYGPHGFVLSNDEKIIYSPNTKSDDMSILDLATGKEERINITFNNNRCVTPVAMGITSDDRYSFITCGKSFDIYKIDNKKRDAVARIAFKAGEFPGPIQTPVHPNNKYIYVPDMRNGVVHKIDIERFTLIKDISAGSGAHGIAFSNDGKKAYVTNTWDNTFSLLDLETDTITKTIKVGSKPNGVAISNGKNQGW